MNRIDEEIDDEYANAHSEKKFHTEKLIINLKNIEKELQVNEKEYLNDYKFNENSHLETSNNNHPKVFKPFEDKANNHRRAQIKQKDFQDHSYQKNEIINMEENKNSESPNFHIEKDIEKQIQENQSLYDNEEMKKKRTRKIILIFVIFLILAVIIFLIVWFSVSNKGKADENKGIKPISNPIDNYIPASKTSSQFQLVNKNSFELIALMNVECASEYVLNYVNFTKDSKNYYYYDYKCIKFFETKLSNSYDMETPLADVTGDLETSLGSLSKLELKCNNNDAITYFKLEYKIERKISYKYKCTNISNPSNSYTCNKYNTKINQGIENLDLLINNEIGRSKNGYLNGFQLKSNQLNNSNMGFSYDVSDCL